MYYYRQEILESLRNFNVRVWGPQDSWFVNRLGDFHMGRPVFGLEKAKAARGASIALNTLHFAEIDSLNCRAFELAGCGAFQMITANNALQRHFVPGVEIETFRSTSELVEKARYYLAHPDSAKEIAAAGQRRAFSEHTYQHRLTEMLSTVGLVR
jgi:spore maturation protein CgeB